MKRRRAGDRDYTDVEYEEFEEADRYPYRPRSSAAPALAIGGILFAFLIVFIVYYAVIYKPTVTPLGVPEGAAEAPSPKSVPKEDPTAEKNAALFRSAERFADDHPEDYADVIARFEKVAVELKDTEYAEKTQARAQEFRDARQERADKYLAAAKEKATALVAEDDFDAALAVTEEIPAHLRELVEEGIDACAADVNAAAAKRIAELFAAAEKRLVDREFEKVEETLVGISAVRYAAATDTAEKVKAFGPRIAEGRWNAKEAELQAIRKSLDTFLKRFDRMLGIGRYEDARVAAEKGIKRVEIPFVASVMKGAAEVAAVLHERSSAVKLARIDLIDTEVALKTAEGEVRKGTVRTFVGDVIELEIPFEQEGASGTVREKFSLSNLAPGEIDRLLPPATNNAPAEWVATAAVAVNEKRYEDAKKALANAGGHSLAGHYVYRIDVAKIGEAEALAKRTWRERLAPRLALDTLSPEQAQAAARIVNAFKAQHGETAFVKSVAASIRALEKKIDDVIGVPEEAPGERPAPEEEPAPEEPAPAPEEEPAPEEPAAGEGAEPAPAPEE